MYDACWGLHSDMGLVDMATSDGRFLFFLPWQGHTIVGTTDHKTPPTMRPLASEDEIQWVINEASKYLSPELHVSAALTRRCFAECWTMGPTRGRAASGCRFDGRMCCRRGQASVPWQWTRRRRLLHRRRVTT